MDEPVDVHGVAMVEPLSVEDAIIAYRAARAEAEEARVRGDRAYAEMMEANKAAQAAIHKVEDARLALEIAIRPFPTREDEATDV